MSIPRRVGPWEELRRRRVVRVTAAYVAVAFALIEVAHRVFVGFKTVEQMSRIALGLAVLGFPVAMCWCSFTTSRPKASFARQKMQQMIWPTMRVLATYGCLLSFLRLSGEPCFVSSVRDRTTSPRGPSLTLRARSLVFHPLVSRPRSSFAFERRCIRAGFVAPSRNSAAIPCRRALPSRRSATLGAQRISGTGHQRWCSSTGRAADL